MSDRMTPVPFELLMEWAQEEYKENKTVFGVYAESFFCADGAEKARPLFGRTVETLVGPAAGPHTQLAQNIAAAYLTGGRFFELKTVQTLDGEDLPVSKPCILARDEGYNVEWSTELTVPQAMEEYIKGWVLLHVLAHDFMLGRPDGFVFNMSVGYDLQGIQSPKISAFIDGLRDASQTDMFKACMEWVEINRPELVLEVSPHICASVTLSTLHGCPPEEIERIAKHLLSEKQLHTFVKLNPTLLGYEKARALLDEAGYKHVSFTAHHFEHDLQFADAVPMLKRLQAFAAGQDREFGVKLTNTFPVRIENAELPGEEMYMSGAALYPLSMETAKMLNSAFDGQLRISFSGGAEAWNLNSILQNGMWPVTVATMLLKPGGYNVLHQLAKGEQLTTSDAQRKAHGRREAHKLPEKVPVSQCYVNPCQQGCPLKQDIPGNIRLAGEGQYKEALSIITARNPMPFTTGTLCPQLCRAHCTRQFCDEGIHIRDVKLLAARQGYDALLAETEPVPVTHPQKAAIVGAGPAGLSAAYFLRRGGVDVTVFERLSAPGGIPAHVIPEFRMPKDDLKKDIELIQAQGVKIVCNCADDLSPEVLNAKGFTILYYATGAWKPGTLTLSPSEGRVMDVLDYLQNPVEAKQVLVVGGGNSAMDAARAAIRNGAEAHIVYRRTEAEMPADTEEIELAKQDGVIFHELLAPIGLQNGILRCQNMKLGSRDASGRRSPVPAEGYTELQTDLVVLAVGNKPEPVPEGQMCGGDAKRGPSTIVEAISDGLSFAKQYVEVPDTPTVYDWDGLEEKVRVKKARRGSCTELRFEMERCLTCGAVCRVCVDVCPNRANVEITLPDGRREIVHLDALCNECGNCETFCPYDSAPYKDKFTFYGLPQSRKELATAFLSNE